MALQIKIQKFPKISDVKKDMVEMSKKMKHNLEDSIYIKSKELGCPFCTLTPQSKQELNYYF